MKENRVFKYKSVRNIRDFRGIVTKDGKTIRSNKIIRSAHLGLLTEEDLEDLKTNHELKKVIDLRTNIEINEKQDKIGDDVVLISDPVFKASTLGITHEMANDRKQVLEMMPHLSTLYIKMVTDDDSVEALKIAVQAIVNNREGSILWHCTEGKDRCGVVSALILSILGVDEHKIYEDYMYTNKTAMRRGNKYYGLVLFAYRSIKKARKVRGLYIARTEYLRSAFDTINEKYGGIDNFVRDKLGITDEMKKSFIDYMTIE